MFSPEFLKLLAHALPGGAPPAPVDIQVLPLNACNARCEFCPLFCLDEEEKEQVAPRFIITQDRLPLELFSRMIEDLARHRITQRLHFTGGEPLLHPDIASMVANTKSALPNCWTVVVTNGILLERWAQPLIRANVDKVSVSLNAGSPESFEAQKIGKAAAFHRAVEGMRLFRSQRRSGQQLAMTVVLNNKNYHEIGPMVEVARAGGVDALTLVPLVRFDLKQGGASGLDANAALALTPAQWSDVEAQLPRARESARKAGIGFYQASRWDEVGGLSAGSLYSTQPCYSGHLFAIVHPDGVVRGCCNCETPLGDLRLNSIDEIWRGVAYSLFRKQTQAIPTEGPPPSCACHECGYLHENDEVHRGLRS